MNFFQILKKSSNSLIENIRGTAIYDHAKQKLEPRSYAQEARPLYLVSKYFSSFYHIISYFIAFLGISLFAGKLVGGNEDLESKFTWLSIFIIGAILLFVIETAKANSSNSVFSAAARKDKYNKVYLGILIVTTLFSFVASVWSAQQLAYDFSTFDKQAAKHKVYLSKLDSIDSIYLNQELAHENTIKSANEILTKKSIPNWQKNTSQENIKSANTSLNEIRKEKESIKEKIQVKHEAELKKIGEKGIDVSKIAMLIFAIFEILNLVCYWFYFYYLSNCLLEKETVLENVTTQIKNEKERNGTHTNNATVYTQPFPSIKPTKTPHTIGFQFQSRTEQNEPKTEGTERKNEPKPQHNGTKKLGYSNCDYCGNEYEMQKKNHRFCQKICRERAWKEKHNRTFIKGKKK